MTMGANDLERRLEATGLRVRIDTELRNELLADGVPEEQADDQAVYVAINDTIHHLCDDGEEAEALTKRPDFWVDEDGDGFTGEKPGD